MAKKCHWQSCIPNAPKLIDPIANHYTKELLAIAFSETIPEWATLAAQFTTEQDWNSAVKLGFVPNALQTEFRPATEAQLRET